MLVLTLRYRTGKAKDIKNLIASLWLNGYPHVDLSINDNNKITTYSSYMSTGVTKLNYWRTDSEYFNQRFLIRNEEHKKIEEIYQQKKNDEYDYFGLITNFVFSKNIDSKKKWYCSEIISYMLKKALYWDEIDGIISPNKLKDYVQYYLSKEENKWRRI